MRKIKRRATKSLKVGGAKFPCTTLNDYDTKNCTIELEAGMLWKNKTKGWTPEEIAEWVEKESNKLNPSTKVGHFAKFKDYEDTIVGGVLKTTNKEVVGKIIEYLPKGDALYAFMEYPTKRGLVNIDQLTMVT